MRGRRSIQFRIAFGLIFILILSVSLSIVLTTSNQRANLLDASQRTLAVNNEMLNATIRNIMLSGEAPIANKTIEDFRNISGFLEFELYRIDGTTAFSDFDTLEFVNQYQDKVMFDSTPRREESLINSAGFQTVLKNKTPVIIRNDELREMEYLFPILNYADCRVCHGEEEFIRGVSHFRISLAGVFDQVNRAGTTLAAFFVTVGVILFAWILFLLRRIIILPVLRIGETVNVAATGNLDVRVDIDSRDEVGELAGRVNAMISGLKERRELELHNQLIETRLEENRKYLDNIKEGLLLLDGDRRISGQYSVYLTRLFDRRDIAGLTLSEFIYPDADAHAEQRQELDGFIAMLYENSTADIDMIMSVNPLVETTLTLADDRNIVVRGDFLRIIEDGELQNVMVIFEDLTDITETRRELEDQRQKRESELEQIATVLKAGPQVFEGFINEASAAFDKLRNNIHLLSDSHVVDQSFRDIHSVKGTARYMDFPKVEHLTHQLEGLLAEKRDGYQTDDAALEESVADLLAQLDAELEEVRHLIDRFRRFAVGGENHPQSPFSVFTDRLTEMIGKIAEELGKEVRFQVESDEDVAPGITALQPSIFHLVRNALDHGIEDSYERLSAGKDSTAVLTMRIAGENGWLRIEIEDDGRGMDLQALEKKGIESGLLKPGTHLPSQIINMLFRPGFSVRDEATNISGRGVGLDAVKEDMRALKGRVNVRTIKGKGTVFILSIPVNEEGEPIYGN